MHVEKYFLYVKWHKVMNIFLKFTIQIQKIMLEWMHNKTH